LMRRRVIEHLDFYRAEATHGEDVDLWLRASTITEFGNVPEVLLKYRVWEGSTSQVLRQPRRETHVRLLASFIKEYLNVDPPIEAVAGLRQMRVGPRLENLGQIRLTADLTQKLYQHFRQENRIHSQERREISWDAAKKLASLALQASRFNTSDSMRLFLRALKIDHRLLSPSSIMKGVETYFRTTYRVSNGQ
jgi:hypothetical protein